MSSLAVQCGVAAAKTGLAEMHHGAWSPPGLGLAGISPTGSWAGDTPAHAFLNEIPACLAARLSR